MLPEITIVGFTLSMYNTVDALAGLTMLLYILKQTNLYREYLPASIGGHRKRTVFAFLQLLTMSLIFYQALLLLNSTFADWFTEGNGNYYGNLTAWLIVMTLLPMIFKVSPLKTMDLLATGLPLSLFVAKLACFFHGCCSGIKLSGSWYYNLRTLQHEFPVQLLEAIVAQALYHFLCWYQKRNKIAGSVVPVYLILYAASRFVTEFFRADLPNVLGPFDAYQVMSVVYALLGGMILYMLRECNHHSSCEAEDSTEVH